MPRPAVAAFVLHRITRTAAAAAVAAAAAAAAASGSRRCVPAATMHQGLLIQVRVSSCKRSVMHRGRLARHRERLRSAQRTSRLGAQDGWLGTEDGLARNTCGAMQHQCSSVPSQTVLVSRAKPSSGCGRGRGCGRNCGRGRGFRKNTEPKNGTKNGATFPVKIALFSLLGTIFGGPELVPLLGAIFGPEMVPDSVSRSLLFWVQVLAPRWKT